MASVYGGDPFSPNATLTSTLHDSPGKRSRLGSPLSTAAVPTRLPREGPGPGNGRVYVFDRSILEKMADHDFSDHGDDAPPAGLNSTQRRPSVNASTMSKKKPKGGSRSVRSGKTQDSDESPRSAYEMKEKKEKPRLTPEERKKAEIQSKWKKVEDQRQRDMKDMLEVVERRHERREDRYKRLIDNITGRDNLAYRTAMALRERQDHEDRRRQELHATWDEKVYQPLAAQANDHMNPPNRAVQQMLHGSKSVGFMLPYEKKTMLARVHEDPDRKPVVEMAKESAFHHAANTVLGVSSSAPNLRKGHVVPRALSRPTLEPTLWSQSLLQGTLFGHFAQVAEQGANFKRARRGGVGVHIPDESDGVSAVGKRKTRAYGHHDLGILKGATAIAGECSQHLQAWGAGSGAPAQDHYTYETGHAVTSKEFPLGKRMFPDFH